MHTAFEESVVIAASPDAVWQRAVTSAGINHELMPLLRMTVPREWRERSLADVVPGERVCRSRLLLLGVLPVGHDDITIAEVGPGLRFREVSPMTGMRFWQHERTVVADAAGALLTDRITFELGRPFGAPAVQRLAAAVLRRFFRHRHRRARTFFRPVRRSIRRPLTIDSYSSF